MSQLDAHLAPTVATFCDAIESFHHAKQMVDPRMKKEHVDAGIVNLAHAWTKAVVDGRLLPEDEARELFRTLVDVSGAWSE